MIELNHSQTIILEDINEDVNIVAAAYVRHIDSKVINDMFQYNSAGGNSIKSQFNTIPSDDNHVASVLSEVNPLLDDNTMYKNDCK